MKAFTSESNISNGCDIVKIKWYQDKKFLLFQGTNAKQIEGDILSKVQKTQMYVHSEEGYINSSFKLSNMHTNDKHIEATIMTLKFKFNAKSLNLLSNRTKILYVRPRLLGTRQVFIRTDIRADTACAYTAIHYPNKFLTTYRWKFLTCYESVLVPDKLFLSGTV